MNSSPRFSILMPTHNRADVIGFAIKSVLAQTEADFELLVVADGCTDNTKEVISSFKDYRIRFFDLPKAPHFGYKNRNIALREARGKLIAFAAHDDLLLPDHLELMGNLLEATNASWGYSRPLWVSTDGIIIPFSNNLNNADEYDVFMEKWNTIPASCVVHTRDALQKVGFWPEDIAAAADWELWKRIIKNNTGHPACLRQPTTLHFSANWKHSRFSNMIFMQTFLSIADHANWWPKILHYPPKGNEPEQVRLWKALELGSASWTEEMRAAIDTVLDKIAWKAICQTIPDYEAMQASTSWKITKPLRKMGAWFRSFKTQLVP